VVGGAPAARRLEVTPQIPPFEARLAGANIRLGVAVRLRLGATLPLDARVGEVRLDGRPVPDQVRRTNRGLEVVVNAGHRAGGTTTLKVTGS
jgi:hypothetical protein